MSLLAFALCSMTQLALFAYLQVRDMQTSWAAEAVYLQNAGKLCPETANRNMWLLRRGRSSPPRGAVTLCHSGFSKHDLLPRALDAEQKVPGCNQEAFGGY